MHFGFYMLHRMIIWKSSILRKTHFILWINVFTDVAERSKMWPIIKKVYSHVDCTICMSWIYVADAKMSIKRDKTHDDVMTKTSIPHCWPFVGGTDGFSSQNAINTDCVNQNKLLNKQLVTVMTYPKSIVNGAVTTHRRPPNCFSFHCRSTNVYPP